MEKPRVGLICLGLSGERNDLAEKFLKSAKIEMQKKGLDLVNPDSRYTLTGENVIAETVYCERERAEVLIYLIGTWILANHVVDAVAETKLPIGIWGVPEPISFSSVGANVVHGTLEELNIRHELFYGFPESDSTLEKIKVFSRAGKVVRGLRKARLGIIGGRAINAYPTSADPNQVKEIFGVEVEHIDQLLLLEKVKSVPITESEVVAEQVKKRYGKIKVPKDILIKSVNVYIALKEIIKEYQFTMCSVKCIGEFMDHYTSCCLAVSMLNDEGSIMGCQCNINAMVSSYIMQMLTNEPTYFGDVNVVLSEERSARVINCGSTPGKFAKSYKDVHIVTQYGYMGVGKGACTLFCCKPGNVTFGTFGRIHGEYVMSIATGEAYEQPLGTLVEVRNWAQGFIRLNCNAETFYRNIRSNHITFCYGDVVKELQQVCGLLNINILLND